MSIRTQGRVGNGALGISDTFGHTKRSSYIWEDALLFLVGPVPSGKNKEMSEML